MSEVKRYTAAMTSCPSGYVVRAEDYDQLKAEVSKQENNNMTLILRMQSLEAENERLSKINHAQVVVHNRHIIQSARDEEQIVDLRKSLDEARELLDGLRGCFVIAAGDKSPFCKLALKQVDAWLEACK